MGIKIIEPNVYEYTDDTLDYKSIDYGDYYRRIDTCDKYIITDQLFNCNDYTNEGERLDYEFPPNYKNNEQGSRKII
jgi:hypothetical protein